MTKSQRDMGTLRQEIEIAEGCIVHATNSKDTAALMKLLSPEILINSPANKVIDRTTMIEVTLKGEMVYSQYENIVEGFALFGANIAIMMGEEKFVHADPSFGNEKVVRRYTDVWQHIEDGWVQIARQATYTPTHDVKD